MCVCLQTSVYCEKVVKVEYFGVYWCLQVFYASEEFGLNSVETAGGYFLMANVFAKQEKPDIASSLYSQVRQHLPLTIHLIYHIHLFIIFYFNLFAGCQ